VYIDTPAADAMRFADRLPRDPVRAVRALFINAAQFKVAYPYHFAAAGPRTCLIERMPATLEPCDGATNPAMVFASLMGVYSRSGATRSRKSSGGTSGSESRCAFLIYPPVFCSRDTGLLPSFGRG